MPLEAIILSRDENALRVFKRLFTDMSIELTVFANSGEALQAIAHHKYDAVVVDCDDVPDARDVLEALRTGRSNRSAIAFALLNGQTTMKQANALGANFVLDKPLINDRVARSVRAAHGLIMRERRRYYRHELNISMNVAMGSREMGAVLINLSEGGCAIRPTSSMLAGPVTFKFTLPETTLNILGHGEVAWNKPDGSIGIRFTQIDARSKPTFDVWLTERAERELKKPNKSGASAPTLRSSTA